MIFVGSMEFDENSLYSGALRISNVFKFSFYAIYAYSHLLSFHGSIGLLFSFYNNNSRWLAHTLIGRSTKFITTLMSMHPVLNSELIWNRRYFYACGKLLVYFQVEMVC